MSEPQMSAETGKAIARHLLDDLVAERELSDYLAVALIDCAERCTCPRDCWTPNLDEHAAGCLLVRKTTALAAWREARREIWDDAS